MNSLFYIESLAITAINAESVQFQNFAGEILIEAMAAALADPRLWPDRLPVVEIMEHGGMALDCDQHVFEAAKHMRPYPLAFERAGAHTPKRTLGRRDTEVVRPEGHEPLDKTGPGKAGMSQPRQRLGAENPLLKRGWFCGLFVGRHDGSGLVWYGRLSERRGFPA
jgi:hypothetical protein